MTVPRRAVEERGPLLGDEHGTWERLSPCGHLIPAAGTPAPTRLCGYCGRAEEEQPTLFEAGEAG